MHSTISVIAVFLLGFACGALAISIWRRRAMQEIQRKFEEELQRISQRHVERAPVRQMPPRSGLDN